MAFDRSNLFCTSGTSGNSPRVYSYGTTDTLDDVQAASYFDSAFRLFRANDIIQAVASGDMKQLIVTSSSSSGVSIEIASGSDSKFRRYVRGPEDFDSPARSDIEYFIDGVVDMGATEVEIPSTGISIAGYDFDTSKLISSENNYTMFTSPIGGSGNVLGKDYAVEVTGTNSKVYDLTSATGFDAFEFARINYNDCTSLGEINGYRQGLETGTGRFGGTPELTLSGSWSGGYFIETSIVRSLDDGSYYLFKAGAGFSMSSRFRSNQNIDLPATAGFLDFSASNFPNPSTLQLQGCLVSRNGVFNAEDTTIVPNITEAELPTKWTANIGLRNTFEGGRASISVETATTVAAANTFYDLNGTWTTSELQHFDSPANGQLRHLGVNPREYSVVADMILDSTANDLLALKLVKWDNSASTFVDVQTQVRQVDSLVGIRDVAYFTMVARVELDQNDYIKFQVENRTAANNVTAELDSFFLAESRT